MFSVLEIGSVLLPNRFAMAPMTTNYAGASGEVTQELVDYLEARARGGFGLIVTENMGVHASGRVMPRMLMADSDALVPGLSRLAGALQVHGTRVFAQLSHCGRQSRPAFTGGELVAPSAIACPINRVVPRALAGEEIVQMVNAFADAAARVAEAGYDGIELHGAHGYLIGEFLSAYANQRDDAWGGTADRRMRFLREIITAIRRRCDLPVCVRISADELVEGGNHIEESLRITEVLAADGVDAISVSAGVYESFNALSMVSGDVAGKWLPLSAQIRQALPDRVKVMGVGRIRSAQAAEQALEDGSCDIPLFGRAAIADPLIPARAAGRVPGPVIACTYCNICLGRSARPETICPVNPAVGRDALFAAELALPSQAKLTIEGGGLAALTAAWIAAARGADVQLRCSEDRVGGMLAERAQVPDQSELADAVAAAWWRARNAGVRLEAPGADACLTAPGADARLTAPGADARLAAPGAGDEPDDGRMHVAVKQVEPLSKSQRSSEANTAALPPPPLGEGWGGGMPPEDTKAPLTVYRILDATHPPDRTRPYVISGDDLAAVDAALKLAAAGARVRLLTTKGALAWDAHPGFRALAREGLQRLDVTQGAADEAPDPAAIFVAGRLQGAPPAVTPDHVINDAWEASVMTTGVYAAAAWAASI